MSREVRFFIIVGTFLVISAVGIGLSLSAPYISSDDEIVYQLGALESRSGDLPDKYVVDTFEFGPYLYPHVLAAWYEPMGHNTFKSAYLLVLILTTGLAAYAMFRLLGLSWTASLLFSAVAIMPRFSAGLEIFGVLTFKEAIGRAMALPLFFISVAFLVKKLSRRERAWPVFFVLGLFVFLHPVTVVLFAGVLLVSTLVTRLVQKETFTRSIVDAVTSGLAFTISSSYFTLAMVLRLFLGGGDASGPVSGYVDAVLFRNAFDFFPGVVAWFPHMFIVSGVFVVCILAYIFLPGVRRFRERAKLHNERDLLALGISIAVVSLLIAAVVPVASLYAMQHLDLAYIPIQWSRASKFYYLGLLVASVPAVYAATLVLKEKAPWLKFMVVGMLVALGLGSSSFFFEVAQYVVGYSNYEKAYIPQRISGAKDDTTPAEYREVCAAIERLGGAPHPSIISGDFALRYYCAADLFTTSEEGFGYFQRSKQDVAMWYRDLLEQRAALHSSDVEIMKDFARRHQAHFIVVPNTAGYLFLLDQGGVVATSRHIVLQVR